MERLHNQKYNGTRAEGAEGPGLGSAGFGSQGVCTSLWCSAALVLAQLLMELCRGHVTEVVWMGNNQVKRKLKPVSVTVWAG